MSDKIQHAPGGGVGKKPGEKPAGTGDAKQTETPPKPKLGERGSMPVVQPRSTSLPTDGPSELDITLTPLESETPTPEKTSASSPAAAPQAPSSLPVEIPQPSRQALLLETTKDILQSTVGPLSGDRARVHEITAGNGENGAYKVLIHLQNGVSSDQLKPALEKLGWNKCPFYRQWQQWKIPAAAIEQIVRARLDEGAIAYNGGMQNITGEKADPSLLADIITKHAFSDPEAQGWDVTEPPQRKGFESATVNRQPDGSYVVDKVSHQAKVETLHPNPAQAGIAISRSGKIVVEVPPALLNATLKATKPQQRAL